MPSCVACGAELEPPVRVPHAVYVKSLYRIAGQDHCRHHIIKAAVAASAITRGRAGVSPVAALPPAVIPAVASDAISSSRTNGFTQNVPCHRDDVNHADSIRRPYDSVC